MSAEANILWPTYSARPASTPHATVGNGEPAGGHVEELIAEVE